MITSFLMSNLAKWIVASTLVSKFVDNLFATSNDGSDEHELADEVQNNENNASFSMNVIEAFELMIKGIKKRNKETLTDVQRSIQFLRKCYFDTGKLIKDILFYIDSTGDSEKEVIKCKIRDIGAYLFFLNSDNDNQKLVNEFLESREETFTNYTERMSGIYAVLLNDKNNKKRDENVEETENINCYIDLLDKAGDIYNELVNYYFELSLIPDKTYNHELVYDMAEFILCETDFYFCRDLRQKQLAEDITNKILKYLQGESQAEKLIRQNYEGAQTNENTIYKHYLGFEIKTYPYYLNICSVIYRELVKYKIGIAEDDEDKEEVTVEKNVFSDMIATLYKAKYDFMQGLSKEQFEKDVMQTYFANKRRGNISEILS